MSTKKTKMRGLYAFWQYSQFPFILGGRVTEMYEDGKVGAEGYTGFRFKPLKLLPVGAGEKLNQKLKDLERNYNQALKQFKKEWAKRADELFDNPSGSPNPFEKSAEELDNNPSRRGR